MLYRSSATILAAASFGVTLLAATPALAEAKNIVLVHGMNMTGGLWRGVHDGLVANDYAVTVVQMPLTSFEADLTAVERALKIQDGPVVLVGHSYGGFVLGEAGMDPDVEALVYVAGFLPEVGETQAELTAASVSHLTSEALKFFEDGHFLIDTRAWIENVANGADPDDARFTAQSQIAGNSAAFSYPATAAAWEEKPTWSVIATEDRTIDPDLQRQMSERAGATVVQVAGGHLVPMTNPDAVVQTIMQAAQSTE